MPPFDHLHPAIVHFAIAPLVLSPLLLGLALAWKAQRRGLLAAAALVLLAGAAAALLSLSTGEAAERFARATPELRAALRIHEAAAQWVARMGALAALLALAAWLWSMRRRSGNPGAPEVLLLGLALVASLMSAAAALRTGHLGGVLVHTLGTHPSPPR